MNPVTTSIPLYTTGSRNNPLYISGTGYSRGMDSFRGTVLVGIELGKQ